MPGFRVGFALLLYDEYSGAAINDAGVIFRYNGQIITPLKKPDGFYVFGTFGGDSAPAIAVERAHYHPMQLRVELLKLPPGNPVVRARLRRSYCNTWRDCVWLAGRCAPDSTVLAVATKPAFQLREARAENGVNTITVFGGGNAGLVGKRFAPEKGTDTFIVTRMISLNDFETDALPGKSPGAKPFARAYLSQSDKDGHYYIPVDDCPEGYPEQVACYDTAKKKWVQAAAAPVP